MKNIFLLLALIVPIGAVSAPSPPSIVETSPKCWEVGVNPSLKAITVTFDQTLRHGFSSWLGRSSVLPESDLDSKGSADGRTSTLALRLQPGKVYVFALNEKAIPGVGFQSKRGIPLAPYFFVFQTAGNPSPDDAPPKVKKTFPPDAGEGVNPAKLPSIVIDFDKPMRAEKHGLHLFEDEKEVDLSTARFGYSSDGLRFSIVYAFQPMKSYRLELNSSRDIGFATTNRIPLWPVRFAFKTGEAIP